VKKKYDQKKTITRSTKAGKEVPSHHAMDAKICIDNPEEYNSYCASVNNHRFIYTNQN
jgi:hypothetical protein